MVEMLEFQGSLNSNNFVDWLNTMKRVFDYYDVVDEMKVRFVAIHFKGSTSSWWEHLQVSHQRSGKGEINN
jgi:hypothetical protein